MKQSPKHIAIFIDSLAGGGAEKVMLVLASKMVALGHRVCLFSLKSVADYEIQSNITLIFPFKHSKEKVSILSNTSRLVEILKKSVRRQEDKYGKFDLSLLNLYESYRLGAAANLNNPYFVIHNSYPQELKREIKMGLLKYWHRKRILKTFTGKRLIGVSKGVCDELSNSKLFKPKSVQHIYNPFDIDKIKKDADLPVGVNVPPKYILHVGRTAKAKRHDILFKAFAKVDSQYKLVCLSKKAKKLHKLSLKYGIADRVVLPGFQKNPYAWMKRADLLVLSSDFEGLSLVLIEALICATPVVSTNCPHGPAEIMQGELAEFLVQPGDADALAHAINKALKFRFNDKSPEILEKVELSTICDQYLALV